MNNMTLRFLSSAVLGAAAFAGAPQAHAQATPVPAPAAPPAAPQVAPPPAAPTPARPVRNRPFVRVSKPFRIQVGALFPTSSRTQDDINSAIFHGGISIDLGATRGPKPVYLGGYIDVDYGQNDTDPPINRLISTGVGIMVRASLNNVITSRTHYYAGAGFGSYSVYGKRDRLVDIPATIGNVTVSRLRYFADDTLRTNFGGKIFVGAEFSRRFFGELSFTGTGSARGYSATGPALSVGARF